MNEEMNEQIVENLKEIISAETLDIWTKLNEEIDALYEMDTTWGKGFGDWVYEYKYRRGGKTLCTFYAKKDVANILIILGKAEREKFELQKDDFSKEIFSLYEQTKTFHDGKWLWIPLDNALKFEDIIGMLKIKRRPNRK